MAQVQLEPKNRGERATGNWYHEMTGYHWFVLLVASLAWLFDCLDQQLFNLARKPAMEAVLEGTGGNVTAYGYFATGIFLIGWGTGGLVFGALGDRSPSLMLGLAGLGHFCLGLTDPAIPSPLILEPERVARRLESRAQAGAPAEILR